MKYDESILTAMLLCISLVISVQILWSGFAVQRICEFCLTICIIKIGVGLPVFFFSWWKKYMLTVKNIQTQKNHEEESRSYLSFHNSCWHMDSGLTCRNMCTNVRSHIDLHHFKNGIHTMQTLLYTDIFKKTYIKAWHIQKNMHKHKVYSWISIHK